MTITSFTRHRALRVVTLALAGLLVGSLTACGSSGGSGAARPAAHEAASHAKAKAPASSDAAAMFHDQMRKLWEQHVAWTRLAIVEFAAGAKGFDATAARLMQNQDDIGDAIKPYYGDAAGEKLASLLHDHIAIAVEILQAAKAGKDADFKDANARWYANAKDIAKFLNSANPKFWKLGVVQHMMKVHLDQTLAEASDELTGKYAASASKYDEIETHILEMADALSAGIVGAFPEKF